MQPGDIVVIRPEDWDSYVTLEGNLVDLEQAFKPHGVALITPGAQINFCRIEELNVDKTK